MITDVIAAIFLFIGCFFLLVVTVGIFRLPDALSRLHLTSKSDPIGTLSVIVAVAIYTGWSLDILRLIAIALLLIVTSVTSSHAIGRSALKMSERRLTIEPPADEVGEHASDT